MFIDLNDTTLRFDAYELIIPDDILDNIQLSNFLHKQKYYSYKNRNNSGNLPRNGKRIMISPFFEPRINYTIIDFNYLYPLNKIQGVLSNLEAKKCLFYSLSKTKLDEREVNFVASNILYLMLFSYHKENKLLYVKQYLLSIFDMEISNEVIDALEEEEISIMLDSIIDDQLRNCMFRYNICLSDREKEPPAILDIFSWDGSITSLLIFSKVFSTR